MSETADDAKLENYIRRYMNDRDEISTIEVTVSESDTAEGSANDQHAEDYIRRYLNDNA